MPLTEKQKQHRKARRLWAMALESGEFKPAKNTLQINNGFCCLGVACLVAEKNGVKVERGLHGELKGSNLSEQNSVQQWLGIKDTNGGFYFKKRSLVGWFAEELTALNDKAKRNPFKKIAKIIRAEPEGLFVD